MILFNGPSFSNQVPVPKKIGWNAFKAPEERYVSSKYNDGHRKASSIGATCYKIGSQF